MLIIAALTTPHHRKQKKYEKIPKFEAFWLDKIIGVVRIKKRKTRKLLDFTRKNVPKVSKLRKLLQQEGWTKTALAESTHVSLKTLWRAEKGILLREETWAKILKGINRMPDRKRDYKMSDIR